MLALREAFGVATGARGESEDASTSNTTVSPQRDDSPAPHERSLCYGMMNAAAMSSLASDISYRASQGGTLSTPAPGAAAMGGTVSAHTDAALVLKLGEATGLSLWSVLESAVAAVANHSETQR